MNGSKYCDGHVLKDGQLIVESFGGRVWMSQVHILWQWITLSLMIVLIFLLTLKLLT